ncbi:MAG: phosphonate ABC transporter ATP-binding protein [Rhodospirillaceae bacterium]|jgi:phosphonate transport system ATP-binding protein|nr:phosphonate ABC transporter ATP-binding protein [Rhodospirillaceae bacterium]MBT5245618.1 phosphonate ABC transporter ATP-binding protein [Rhodospirillaceae bacterium]MBT5561134.1 phosphonate ABC transporter ATP-binding protein [Rhodospirillaceae bacterium]MBT6242830.1 phosphonate ABC transporter ATP-binding protein [Rhodospirillaceae bacterium]MBT7138777.1 phosphonate ABC transporter ATP-binding protein [Rhodospirillaceae bacterium]
MLTIQNLVKIYPTGAKALNGVSFSVDDPKVITIIGPSGAGKSTLIRCINRLVDPTSGQILLDGMDIAGLGSHGLRKARRRMGMIFQEYNLVERLTVMENVLSGRLGYIGFWRAYRRKYPPEDVSAAFKLLDRVGLDGYQNTRADALSGGQRQRVGIARALMQRPDLLLVDEPTASLDPKTSRQIMRLLVELARENNTPALINIHDVALAQTFSDRIIGLADGRIVFDGTAEQVTADVLTQIYGEEDWSTTIRKVDDEDEGGGETQSKEKPKKDKGLIRESSSG